MMKGRRFNRPQSVADVKAFLKDGVIPEPKVEIPIVEDDDATILNPPISEPDDVPEEPKEEEPKEEGPKEEKPKKEKPKEEDPPKKDPIVEIPSDNAPGSGKRKLIYAASAAVVVAIVIFLDARMLPASFAEPFCQQIRNEQGFQERRVGRISLYGSCQC